MAPSVGKSYLQLLAWLFRCIHHVYLSNSILIQETDNPIVKFALASNANAYRGGGAKGPPNNRGDEVVIPLNLDPHKVVTIF